MPSAIVALLILIGSYGVMRWIVRPPFPPTLTNFFMIFVLAGVLIYITLEDRRIEEFLDFLSFESETKRVYRIMRIGALVLIPVLAAYQVHSAVKVTYSPPGELFQPHVTPPEWVVGLKVPDWAADPAKWDRRLIEEGKAPYDNHCAPCHGKNADGKGPEAKALRYPAAPTDFTESGTIAQLPLSYVYWRIKEGGIRDKQFLSAMPGWEEEMDEEEIWKTILYMYTKAGVKPRTW